MFLSTGMPSRTQLQPLLLLLHGVIDKAPAITAAPLHPLYTVQCDRFRCKLCTVYKTEQKELPLRNDCYWLTIMVKNNRNRTRLRLLIDSTSWWRSRPFAVYSFVFKWRVTAFSGSSKRKHHNLPYCDIKSLRLAFKRKLFWFCQATNHQIIIKIISF